MTVPTIDVRVLVSAPPKPTLCILCNKSLLERILLMTDTIILPTVNVQHDFQAVINDVEDGLVGEEDFWVSCYKNGEKSVHGKVRVGRDEYDKVELKSRGGIEFEYKGRESITVTCPTLSIPPTSVWLPDESVKPSEKSKQILSFDVSPDLSQLAIGYADGTIQRLGVSSSAAIQSVTYRPHVSCVTSVRFFPSSRVILSGGMDFSLTILDAKIDPNVPVNPEPVRTLRGHSRAITDTAIVARGRNVVSCAKDGTVRLWDVGGGSQISVFGSTAYASVMKLALGEKVGEFARVTADGDEHQQQAPQGGDEREVDTNDKLVFCALSNGILEAFDLGTRKSIFQSPKTKDGSLTAVAYSPADYLVATGSSKGVVTVYDTRAMGTQVTSFSRNGSFIEDLTFVRPVSEEPSASVRLVIGTEDGLPFVADVRPEGPDVYAELIGANCEAIRVTRVDSAGKIWVAGDDGVVRRY